MDANYFDEIRELSKNLIAVRQGYKWGLYNNNSQVLMRIIYDYISEEDGRLWARYHGYKFYIPQEWLPMSYDCIYDYVEYAHNKKWAKVVLYEKIGVINQDYKQIVPCDFDNIQDFNGALWLGKKLNENDTVYSVYSYEGVFYSCYGGISYPIVRKKINNDVFYGIIDKQSKEIVKAENKSISLLKKSYNSEEDEMYDVEKDSGLHFLFSSNEGLYDIEYNKLQTLDSFVLGNRWQQFSHFNDTTSEAMLTINHPSANYVDVYKEDGHFLFSFKSDEYELTNYVIDNSFICQSKLTQKYGMINGNSYIIPCVYDELSFDKYNQLIVGIRNLKYEKKQYKVTYGFYDGDDDLELIRYESKKNGIVDIYHPSGVIMLHEVDYQLWNSSRKYYYQGCYKLQINILVLSGNRYIFKNGKLLISPGLYDEVSSFIIPYYNHNMEREYAFVRKGEKWGVINIDGDLLIPIVYDKIFECFRIQVSVNGKFLFKYKYLIAEREGYYSYYEANRWLKTVDETTMKDLFYHYWFEVHHEDYIWLEEELFDRIKEDYINDTSDSKERVSKWFKIVSHNQNNNCIIAKDVKTSKLGLLDNFENKLCDFIFDSISNFNKDGIAIAKIKGEGQGLITREGKIILPCKYKLIVYNNSNDYYIDDRLEFTEGYLIICVNKLYGLVDKDGRIVVPCKYPKFASFHCGQTSFLNNGYILVENEGYEGLVCISSSEDYFLNCCYKKIELYPDCLRYQYSSHCNNYSDCEKYIIAIGETECKIFEVNRNKIILNLTDVNIYSVPFIYGNYIIVASVHNGSEEYGIYEKSSQKCIKKYSIIGKWNGRYIQVSISGKWGILDLERGKETIPCEYYENEDINNDGINLNDPYSYPLEPYFFPTSDYMYIIAKKNGKYGIIDKRNHLVLDFIYDSVHPFFEGLAAVKIDDKWGFVNEGGESIAYGFEYVLDFSDGLAAVRKNGKWGYINKNGILKIPYRFASAGPFSDGLAAVAFKKYYGYIDKHNKTIIPFNYKIAWEFEEGIAYVSNYGSGHISKDGYVIDWEYPRKPYVDDTDYGNGL